MRELGPDGKWQDKGPARGKQSQYTYVPKQRTTQSKHKGPNILVSTRRKGK
jgi:hypothetical protein